jgi:hypothetical protein
VFEILHDVQLFVNQVFLLSSLTGTLVRNHLLHERGDIWKRRLRGRLRPCAWRHPKDAKQKHA